MARRLLEAGETVVVWNRSPGSLETLVAEGAIGARDVETVFDQCSTVLLMLAGEYAIDDVLDRASGGLHRLVPGRTVVNLGTVSPQYSLTLEDEIGVSGGVFVEAPVSGSRGPAERGELVISLAGAPVAVDRVRRILAPLARQIDVIGAIPTALTLHLAVNAYRIMTATALAEVFAFAERHRLDPALLKAVLDAGQVASPYSREKSRALLEHDYAPDDTVAETLANVRRITAAASWYRTPTPVLDVVRELFLDAVARGDGALDLVAVTRTIAEQERVWRPRA